LPSKLTYGLTVSIVDSGGTGGAWNWDIAETRRVKERGSPKQKILWKKKEERPEVRTYYEYEY
jgi:hypothetical protein